MNKEQFDDVQRPEHYNSHPSGLECVVINENFSGNLAAAIKYVWRKDLKEAIPLRDLKKAEWYLNREIKRAELEGDSALCHVASDYTLVKANMLRVIRADGGLLGQVLSALLGEPGAPRDIVGALRRALAVVQEAIRHSSSGPE